MAIGIDTKLHERDRRCDACAPPDDREAVVVVHREGRLGRSAWNLCRYHRDWLFAMLKTLHDQDKRDGLYPKKSRNRKSESEARDGG